MLLYTKLGGLGYNKAPIKQGLFALHWSYWSYNFPFFPSKQARTFLLFLELNLSFLYHTSLQLILGIRLPYIWVLLQLILLNLNYQLSTPFLADQLNYLRLDITSFYTILGVAPYADEESTCSVSLLVILDSVPYVIDRNSIDVYLNCLNYVVSSALRLVLLFRWALITSLHHYRIPN